MRVILYADDAVIFANPIKEEVDCLLELLHSFGEATSLKLNQAKSSVIPMNCDAQTLEEVLHGFGGAIASFPTSYRGCLSPLSDCGSCTSSSLLTGSNHASRDGRES